MFGIEVVDAETGRGIPAVELGANNGRSWYTDSAGRIAVLDPGLMGKRVFFRVGSFGYTYEGSVEEIPGVRLHLRPGRRARLEMRRDNVAQRLYRVTGVEPYRDSVLLGETPPFRPKPLAQQPAGIDSVFAVPYRGRLFWVWGDAWQLAKPAPLFRTTAATSLLPRNPTVDPGVGIDLRYFADGTTLREMVADEHPVIWLSALRSVPDAAGEEHLFATYRKVAAPLATLEQGLAEYDDAEQRFRLVAAYPDDAPVVPDGHAFHYREEGTDVVQYDLDVRSEDGAEAVRDLARYEAFTPARSGSRLGDGATALERDGQGRLRWGWKRDAPRIPYDTWQAWEESGAVAPAERPFRLVDVENGETVAPHNGSIHWNAYRGRWIMIRGQDGGPVSPLGEVYYFEADTPLGPWAYGRKVVSHSRPAPRPFDAEARETYSFYNPMHHPEFDRDGGRVIFFEGTFSSVFAAPRPRKVPDYDYNQLMYELALDDPRLFLPVPVYRRTDAPLGTRRHASGAGVPGERPTRLVGEIAFFAPDRPRAGTVPIRVESGSTRLVRDPAATGADARFHCADEPPPATVPLYEHTGADGRWTYSLEGAAIDTILCYVWPSPVDYGGSLGSYE